MKLIKRISDWERGLRAYYNTDLSTPENRRRAHIYNLWFDHAVLRKVWTNFFPVAPGVYRSNQPTHERFVKLKAMGIKSILNLRGAGGSGEFWVPLMGRRDRDVDQEVGAVGVGDGHPFDAPLRVAREGVEVDSVHSSGHGLLPCSGGLSTREGPTPEGVRAGRGPGHRQPRMKSSGRS